MDIKQLGTFIHVAKSGSLSKAAGKLHVAQPALSRQISMLENDLRIRLFTRHGRGMKLTEAGELLLARAQSILSQIEDTRTDLLSLESTVHGQVRLGLPPTVGDVLAAPLIEKFRLRFPAVTFKVVPAFSGYLVDLLHQGDIDLAILYGVERGLNLDFVPLVEERLYLVGPGSAGFSRQVSVSLACVARHNLVLPSAAHGLRVLIDNEARRRNIALTVPIEVDALQTLKDLVKRNVGFTILPLAAVHREVAEGVLTAGPISDPALLRTLVLASPSWNSWSKATRIFADMLLAEIYEMAMARILDGRILATRLRAERDPSRLGT
ncbi:MAG: LysR substrate-binding domain-containing protein [Pseudaminobacter sp.]